MQLQGQRYEVKNKHTKVNAAIYSTKTSVL